MKKKGISLVALVVTIIVLIILTGAVVATFMEGGIITNAKEAVMKSDYTTLVEAYDVKYNTAKIDEVTGTGEITSEVIILKDVVDDLGLKGFTFDIDNEKVNYTGDNTYISDWVISNFKFIKLVRAGFNVSNIKGNIYLSNVKTSERKVVTNAEDILNCLDTECIMVNAKDEQVSNETIVLTGYKVMNGENVILTVIVKGKTNLAGTNFSTTDVAKPLQIVKTNGEKGGLNGGSAGDIELLASDINNDGYVTMDDVNFMSWNATISGVGEIMLDKAQKVDLKEVTEIMEAELYTWHTVDSIKGNISNLSESNLTIASGTTYQQLENNLKNEIGIKGVSLDAENKSNVVQNGDEIVIRIPLKISETEYSKVNEIKLTAVVE